VAGQLVTKQLERIGARATGLTGSRERQKSRLQTAQAYKDVLK